MVRACSCAASLPSFPSCFSLLPFLAFIPVAACDCSETNTPPPIPDASFDTMLMVDSGTPPPRDAMSTCDDTTGEGCPCPGEGETRSCETGAVGACGLGTQDCVAGFEFPLWGTCAGEAMPSEETCNGIDDNCDGTLDEGFGDVSCGAGACAVTTPECVSGVVQTCVPGASIAEVCDGLDNDCDGTVDQGLGDLSCGVGACAATVAACASGVIQVCEPGMAAVEICNGVDDDCNGTADEGLGNLSCGVGECAVTVAACAGGTPMVCSPGMATSEICDGLDNDCNGTIDDGFGTTVCGVGECERVVLDCAGGSGGPCTPGTPVGEVCDGLDNDCDGIVDDGFTTVSCGIGVCQRTVAACTGGVPGMCTPGVAGVEICNGLDDDCDGTADDGLGGATSCGVGACERMVATCSGGVPGICTPGSPVAEVCGDAIDNDCDGTADELCGCDPTVDADFDTFNECVDCNDANGGVYPGRAEVCNGIDEDCDMLIDEDFDGDGDGFSTCSTDPLLRDCNDSAGTVYPGAPELCGTDGTGNGIDENCNGFIDETCNPCDPVDTDGDGVAECDGDCEPDDPLIAPGRPEVCDGVDNDCNIFTVQNCGVSDECHFASGADVCTDDLLCGQVIGRGGMLSGNWVCTSMCEGSYTGELGAGCTATQTCLYRVTATDNLHGCAETADPIGTLGGGAVCGADDECRSGNCDKLCVGPGCNTKYCIDYCSHHDPGSDGSCAAGSICELRRIVTATTRAMYATCQRDDNGAGTTGSSCAGSTSCLWGTQSCVSGICAEPCALDSQCPTGTHCSFQGGAVNLGTYGATAPSYVAGMTATETVPVCLTNTGAGLHNRQAGAACTQNGDCESQFCEATLNVCIAGCTSDSSCPTGLGCDTQYITTSAGVTFARVCVSSPVDALLTPR
ncbi:MAG: hypothetical protein DRJ42_24400 [Deltaproteobacteria bacterium]|nr:MAG: hypothetical protein DRJ42_24400 [Deltaproteobacteria bacterium]